jgi:hypothetical protein
MRWRSAWKLDQRGAELLARVHVLDGDGHQPSIRPTASAHCAAMPMSTALQQRQAVGADQRGGRGRQAQIGARAPSCVA